MDFELSPELSALQASVRRLAQDKVKPRARAIDSSGEYPDDIFAVFRDAGLLGLCLPEDVGGSGAGIFGLTIAIEEVAKYSNTAALMLLLTRLPTGPVMIAGSEEQKQRYLPGIADGSQRAAFGLSEPQAGSDVMGMRTRAVRRSRFVRWVDPERDQVLDVRGARGRLVHRLRQDVRSHQPGPRLGHRLHRRTGLATVSRWAGPTTRWACGGSTPVSSS